MTASEILIVATDPLAGALLGAAVELAGYAPVFPREGESAREALRRSKPCAVLVDCDSDDACGEAFFGPAMMMGASIAIFTSSRSRRALQPIADEYGVRVFDLPIDFAELKALLDACSKTPRP
jgi:DNA-binding NtrC family response regulator